MSGKRLQDSAKLGDLDDQTCCTCGGKDPVGLIGGRRPSQSLSVKAADGRPLSYSQVLAGRIFLHPWFQCIMTAIIVGHMALTVQQTDQNARNEKPHVWQDVCDKFFLIMYLIDIVLRLWCLRQDFFLEKMNIFDLFIVAVDTTVTVLDTASSGTFDVGPISLFRALRALRIVRVIRRFATFRDLYLMLKGMGGAMRAIFFAFLLILIVLTMFSIAAVEMIHPLSQDLARDGVYKDCDWCENAFASVMDANLTLFSTILAGDSWGKLAIPLMEASPPTSFIIISAFVIIELGLINVIIAIVVDRQAQAREEDKELQHTLKEEQAAASYKELVSLFKTMDSDGSGSLSVDEIIEAFEQFEEFRKILQAIDVSVDDLVTVFASMDRDRDGNVDYEEFVSDLHRMRTMEVRTLLYLTRQHVVEMKETMKTLTQHVLGSSGTRPSAMDEMDTECNALQQSGLDQSPAFVCNNHQSAEASKKVPAASGKLSISSGRPSLADEQLRLARLEHQFITLESRVAQTARLSQDRISGLVSCASTTATCETCELDVKDSIQTKIQTYDPGEIFLDEVVPALTPSATATPGRDLHLDGALGTPHVRQLPGSEDYENGRCPSASDSPHTAPG